MSLRKVLPAAEAASALGVSLRTVSRLFKTRKLAGFKVGRKTSIFEDSIEDFQKRHSNCFPEKGCFTKEENKPIQENSTSRPRSNRRRPSWKRHG